MADERRNSKHPPSLAEQARHLSVRRARAMARLRTKGWTLDRVAQKYGVTRQRVHQLLRTHAAELTDVLPASGSEAA